LRELLAGGAAQHRNPASRFSFVQGLANILLFADGQCFGCSEETAAFAQQLCSQDHITVDPDLVKSDKAVD